MQNYTVIDRVNSKGYAQFLSEARADSWVAENEFGQWEVRVPRAA